MIEWSKSMLASLKNGVYKIECVVTGDIDYVGESSSNFMSDRCAEAGVDCWLPLWKSDREVRTQGCFIYNGPCIM